MLFQLNNNLVKNPLLFYVQVSPEEGMSSKSWDHFFNLQWEHSELFCGSWGYTLLVQVAAAFPLVGEDISLNVAFVCNSVDPQITGFCLYLSRTDVLPSGHPQRPPGWCLCHRFREDSPLPTPPWWTQSSSPSGHSPWTRTGPRTSPGSPAASHWPRCSGPATGWSGPWPLLMQSTRSGPAGQCHPLLPGWGPPVLPWCDCFAWI